MIERHLSPGAGAAATDSPRRQAAPADRIRVLLADDAAPMRAVLRVLLELDRRIEVVGEAVDGGEAVVLAEKRRPDCVLLDLDMPVLSGIEALPEIKRRVPSGKVIVFSGFDGETPEKVLAAGADACLEKLTGIQALVPTIVRVCSRNGAGRIAAGARDVGPGRSSPAQRVGSAPSDVRSPEALPAA